MKTKIYINLVFFFITQLIPNNQSQQVRMRQHKSAQKQLTHLEPRFQQVHYNVSRLTSRTKGRQQISDAEIIERHYVLYMTKVYHQKIHTYPDPSEIIKRIKAKQKKLAKFEQQLRDLQNKKNQKGIKSLKSFEKTQQDNTLNDDIKLQQTIRDIICSQYLKVKIKFMPFLEKYMAKSQQFLQLSKAQDEKMFQALLECLNFLIKTFTNEIKETESKFTNKLKQNNQSSQKKIQFLQQKHSQQVQRLTQKNKKLQEQLKNQIQLTKRLEKQKSLDHSQLTKYKLEASQKIRRNQGLVELILNQQRKCEQLNKKVSELQKKIKDQQVLLKQYVRQITQLQWKNKNISQDNQAISKQLLQEKKRSIDAGKKLQQLQKSSSRQNLTSIKSLEQQSNYQNQIRKLKQQIKNLKNREGDIQKWKLQVEINYNKAKQRIINDWKQKCTKIVQQSQTRQTIHVGLIKSLQDQIAQFMIQIELCKKLVKQHRPDLAEFL